MNVASVPRGVVPIPSDSDLTKNVQIHQPTHSKDDPSNLSKDNNEMSDTFEHDITDTGIIALTDPKSGRTVKSHASSRRSKFLCNTD